MLSSFNGDFFDEDYFQRGVQTGKSHYTAYHWMPQRSYREALAFIDLLGLDSKSFILEFGCAFGYLVKAFRNLEINADGCDISDYALSNAPEGCWNCSDLSSFDFFSFFGYTHIICKDVLEHLDESKLRATLKQLRKVAKIFAVVVPIGDNGVYRIKEYHEDASHIIAENEIWWRKIFRESGWTIYEEHKHIHGIKDNWYKVNQDGNRVFVLERL